MSNCINCGCDDDQVVLDLCTYCNTFLETGKIYHAFLDRYVEETKKLQINLDSIFGKEMSKVYLYSPSIRGEKIYTRVDLKMKCNSYESLKDEGFDRIMFLDGVQDIEISGPYRIDIKHHLYYFVTQELMKSLVSMEKYNV